MNEILTRQKKTRLNISRNSGTYNNSDYKIYIVLISKVQSEKTLFPEKY